MIYAESDGMEMVEKEEEKRKPNKGENQLSNVYLPGGELQEGEELVHDSSTYRMYHVVGCIPNVKDSCFLCVVVDGKGRV